MWFHSWKFCGWKVHGWKAWVWKVWGWKFLGWNVLQPCQGIGDGATWPPIIRLFMECFIHFGILAHSENLRETVFCNFSSMFLNPNIFFQFEFYNLFTTSESPNIRIPILQIFVFIHWRGTRKYFLLVENIFWTNEKCFLVPLQ